MLIPFIKGISRNHFELWVEDLKPHQKVDSTKGLLKADQIYNKRNYQIYRFIRTEYSFIKF